MNVDNQYYYFGGALIMHKTMIITVPFYGVYIIEAWIILIQNNILCQS